MNEYKKLMENWRAFEKQVLAEIENPLDNLKPLDKGTSPLDNLKPFDKGTSPLDNLKPFDKGTSPLAGLETKPPPTATDVPAVTTAPTTPPVATAAVPPIEVDQPDVDPVELPPIELPDEISSMVPEGGSAGAWEIGDDPQSAMENADLQAKARYKGSEKGKVVSRKVVGGKLYSVYGPASP